MIARRAFLLGAAALWSAEARAADAPIALSLVIKDNRFSPAELRAPRGRPIELTVENQDGRPEEFESDALRLERVIGARRKSTFRIAPLEPGRYEFIGEYHADTARGVLIVD